MQTVTEITRKEVWDGLVELEIAVRYCQKMHKRHQFLHIIFSVILAGSGAGGIVSLLAHAPIWVQVGLNAIIPCVAIWSIIVNEGKKSHVFYVLTGECTRIKNEYRELWVSIYNYQISNDDVLFKLKELNSRYSDIKSMNGSDIQLSDRVNKKATEEGHEYLTPSAVGAAAGEVVEGVGQEPV